MKCPHCQAQAIVLETRTRLNHVYRRLICSQGHKFSVAQPKKIPVETSSTPGEERVTPCPKGSLIIRHP